MQRIGAQVDDDGVTFEMDGSATTLTSLLVALVLRFAKQLSKAYGEPEVWIDVICQKAKDELNGGDE